MKDPVTGDSPTSTWASSTPRKSLAKPTARQAETFAESSSGPPEALSGCDTRVASGVITLHLRGRVSHHLGQNTPSDLQTCRIRPRKHATHSPPESDTCHTITLVFLDSTNAMFKHATLRTQKRDFLRETDPGMASNQQTKPDEDPSKGNSNPRYRGPALSHRRT